MTDHTSSNKENCDLTSDFERWKSEGDKEFEKLLNAKKASLKRNDGFLARLFRIGEENIERNIDSRLLDMNFDEYERSISAACQSVHTPERKLSDETSLNHDKPERKRRTVINTPINPRKLPKVITPKVTCSSEVQARVLEPDEVAFSITGSPVVVAPGTAVDEEVQQIADLLEMDEQEFTPETRKVVHGLRTVMKKLRSS